MLSQRDSTRSNQRSLRHVAFSVSTRTNQGSINLSIAKLAPTSNATTSIAKDVHAIDSPLLKASFRHRKRSRHSSLPSHEGIDATTYALLAYVCHRSCLDRTQASTWLYTASSNVIDRLFRNGDPSSHRTIDLVTEEAANPHIDHHTSEGKPTDGSILTSALIR